MMSRKEEPIGLITRAVRTVRRLLVLAGLCAVAIVVLAFTNVPWRLYSWLGDPGAALEGSPTCIVILGGGGIPSGSGLMRTYFGAVAAIDYPHARVMVCLPADGDPETSSVGLMKRELTMRGIPEERILLEHDGRSTREQALMAAKLLGDGFETERILIVTSVEHMRRSRLSFTKAGFERVSGRSAYATAAEADMRVGDEDLGDTASAVTEAVGQSLMIRYRFWDHIGYMTRSARELTALAYYWVRGWI